jgi:hypothetical protein
MRRGVHVANDDPDASRRDAAVDEVIENCDGDARAAVAELLAIVRTLVHENQTLREAPPPRFARQWPMVFGKSA